MKIKISMKFIVLVLGLSLIGFSASNTSEAKGSSNDPWVSKDKVRCLAYIDSKDKMASEKIRKTRELGFNCVLSTYVDSAQVKQLNSFARLAGRYGIGIIWVSSMMDQFSNPLLAEKLKRDKRRFVGEDGRESSQSPCPTDETYWDAVLLGRAEALATLSRKGCKPVNGLLLDMEDYSGFGDWDHYCYCDDDFYNFLRSIGTLIKKNITPAERYHWLECNGLLERYKKFQDSVVVSVFKGIRQEIDKIDPEFEIAMYPWDRVNLEKQVSYSRKEIYWDERLVSGLGTPRAPFLLFIENTYVWGYDPSVEAASEQLKEKSLHFAAVSGFNVCPSERVWFPQEMADNAYYASIRSDGYWIFEGGLTFFPDRGGSLSPRIGGTYKQWAFAFKRVNALITQTLKGQRLKRKVAPLSLRPLIAENPTFCPSDLFSYKYSDGTEIESRQWMDIGLPWKGGELVFHGKKVGDSFSFERDFSMTDRYLVSAWFTKGPDRGIAQLFQNGKPVGRAVDLYAPIVEPRCLAVAGTPFFANGRGRLEFRVAGKNPKSKGYEIGFSAIVVEQIGWWAQQWYVLLPFENEISSRFGYSEGFSKEYPPEVSINLDSIYVGKRGGLIRWKKVEANENGYLDFKPLVTDVRNNVAYALVYAYSPTSGLRKIFLGTDDGGKLWINDKFVWGEDIFRSAKRNDDAPVAYLYKGWNKILLKVTQRKLGWGLYFRIYDPDHQIRYSVHPDI